MMDAAKIREALENAIDVDGPGAQDSDIRTLRALLDSGFLEAAMEWGDWYARQFPTEENRSAEESKMCAAYRRLVGTEPKV